MFGKKVFLLLWWYVAGSLVASLYTSKKGKDIKAELKKAKKDGKDELSVLFDNVFVIQKRFFDDIQDFMRSPKTKAFLESKVEDTKDYIEDFKNKSQILIDEFQKNGIGKTSTELRQKIEVLYDDSKNQITRRFQDISPDTLEDLKKKLHSSFQELKSLIKK